MKQPNAVMFHVGRSGSRVLGDLFHQHPQVYWDGEVYERLFHDLERILGRQARAGDVTIDPTAHLQGRRVHACSRESLYGFEVEFFHLEILQLELVDFLHRLDALGFERFVVLERTNTLRKVISSLIAHKTGRWHVKQDGEDPARVRIDIDRVMIDRSEKTLIDYLCGYAESFRQLRAALQGRTTLYLTYEDDIYPDPLIAYRRTCSFLGLLPHDVAVRFKKTNPFELKQMVDNLEDVAKSLRGTPFEWMICD